MSVVFRQDCLEPSYLFIVKTSDPTGHQRVPKTLGAGKDDNKAKLPLKVVKNSV